MANNREPKGPLSLVGLFEAGWEAQNRPFDIILTYHLCRKMQSKRCTLKHFNGFYSLHITFISNKVFFFKLSWVKWMHIPEMHTFYPYLLCYLKYARFYNWKKYRSIALIEHIFLEYIMFKIKEFSNVNVFENQILKSLFAFELAEASK